MAHNARWLWVLATGLAIAACSGDPAPEQAATPAPGAAIATPAPAATETAATEAPKTVAELLESARTAMREQRLIQPVGNNAIEMYLQVLEQEPDNRQAQLAILELMPLAQGVAEQMIDGRRLDEAQQAIALLKKAQPDSVVVTTLEQRIIVERRAEEQRAQAEEEQARLAEQRQRDEAEAARVAATAPAAAPAEPARAAPQTTTVPPARSSEPESAPPVTPPPAAPATQLASAAPAPSIASTTAPQNKDFSLVRRVDPDYPSQALRARTEGWVELSFTITESGDVENVTVVNANPRRVFDREAMRALSQWKFTPRTEGGKPVAAKARQRLEFSLD